MQHVITNPAPDYRFNISWQVRPALQPSTFRDYCAAHGRCLHCESTGIVLDERRGGFNVAGRHEGAELFERRPACDCTEVERCVLFPGMRACSHFAIAPTLLRGVELAGNRRGKVMYPLRPASTGPAHPANMQCLGA
jgi:hypothetical protein